MHIYIQAILFPVSHNHEPHPFKLIFLGQYCKSYTSPGFNSFFDDFREMADLSENMNMEALVGVIMGILFTILISLILLLMKRNKKSEKVFGT